MPKLRTFVTNFRSYQSSYPVVLENLLIINVQDALAAEVAAARHRVRSLESRAAESDAALRAARDALSRSEERCRSLEGRSQAMEEEAGRARRDAAESER